MSAALKISLPTRLLRALAALAFLGACAAHADALDDVMKAGVLRVAVTLDYPPFGQVDASMKPQGYDVEFAALVARSMGVKAELVSVNAQSKIPTLVTGKADLLLNIGYSDERAKAIDFASAYAPYYVGVFGPPEQKVASAADLNGKIVSVTRGTLEDQLLTKAAAPGVEIRRFDDHTGTISAFLSGQSDLISVGNVVAAGLLAKNPPRKPEQKFLLLNSPVRAAVAKGQTRLLDKVNAAIAGVKKDGTLAGMASNWLKQPLPENL